MGFLELFNRYYHSVTDGPDLYARAAGYVAAGLILARRIALPRFTRNIKPNLWCCLVGPTTIVRKSTSIELAARIGTLDGLEYYKSVTPEKATQLVSCGARLDFFTTEYKNLMEGFHKEYNSGLTEAMTELYDGHVVTVKRETLKGSYKSDPNTTVTITTATTEEWLADVLNECSDLAGGFIPRFILVYSPTRDKPIRSDDAMYSLAMERVIYNAIPKQQQFLRLHREAMPLLAAIEEESRRQIHSSGLVYMDRATARAAEQTLKLAMIEAVDRGDTTILADDVRKAHTFIGQCNSMLAVLDKKLSITRFSKRLETLLKIIRQAPDGKATFEYLANNFNSNSPREIEDLLSFAEKAARLEKGILRNGSVIDAKQYWKVKEITAS